MRFRDISHTHAANEDSFNTVTIFVPRERVEEFISTLSLFNARILETRILTRFEGYSVDALLDNPKVASDFLLAWCL